ncbi:MAG TPA: sulfurtransferase [Vicinamibacterales bacterium]|jgi:thiosulfate/3-mercaptopyruvate sulfurtransferase
MGFTTLISTSALAKCVGEHSAIAVDCRFKLDDAGWGESAFREAHIPGAVYAHLDRDLSGPKTGTNGRHPLPDIDTFVRTLGRLGVRNGAQVVAYDQDNGMYASRLWWMLRWMGHDAVAVLDGGFAAWIGEHRPTERGEAAATPAAFTAAPRAAMLVDLAGVSGITQTGSALLLDARAPQRYRGETESLDRVAGHIPTAKNYFFQQNIDNRGVFKSPADLRSQLTAAIGSSPAENVVCYCGSGVTACHNLLAMEHAGLTGARLYPGSWSEWCASESRPVATGE